MEKFSRCNEGAVPIAEPLLPSSQTGSDLQGGKDGGKGKKPLKKNRKAVLPVATASQCRTTRTQATIENESKKIVAEGAVATSSIVATKQGREALVAAVPETPSMAAKRRGEAAKEAKRQASTEVKILTIQQFLYPPSTSLWSRDSIGHGCM